MGFKLLDEFPATVHQNSIISFLGPSEISSHCHFRFLEKAHKSWLKGIIFPKINKSIGLNFGKPVSEQHPRNVSQRSPFLLERVNHPGTAFTLAVLLLSRARELHTHPTFVESLLPACCSDAISPTAAHHRPVHPPLCHSSQPSARPGNHSCSRSIAPWRTQADPTPLLRDQLPQRDPQEPGDDLAALLSLLLNDWEHRAADATAPTTVANSASLVSDPASGTFNEFGCRNRFANGTQDVELFMALLDRAANLVATLRATPATSHSSTAAHSSTRHIAGRSRFIRSSMRLPARQHRRGFRPKSRRPCPNRHGARRPLSSATTPRGSHVPSLRPTSAARSSSTRRSTSSRSSG